MFRKLLIATLLLCGIAWAQPPMGGPGMMNGGPGMGGHHDNFGGPGSHMMMPLGRWWKNAQVAKNLGLNDDQVQKIEQIFLDSRIKLIDAHANLQKEEVKLEPLLAADNPDEKAVLSAIDRITAARAAEEKTFAQMCFAVRRVLTPEQWKKLRSMHPMGRFSRPNGGPRHDMQHNMEHKMHDGDSQQHMMHHPSGQPPATPAPDDGAAPATNN